MCVGSEARFDFLKDLVSSVPGDRAEIHLFLNLLNFKLQNHIKTQGLIFPFLTNWKYKQLQWGSE